MVNAFCRLSLAAAAIASADATPNEPSPGFGGIDNVTLAFVRSNMLQVSTESWELGTAAEALIEYSWPELSVFNESAFPPPSSLTTSKRPIDVLDIAYEVVSTKAIDKLALVEDAAVGDPPSLGVAVLLANWTRSDKSDASYSSAARKQLEYLLNHAPRTSSGAISHRADQVQLWADFIYMVPPFIAYFGSLAGGDAERLLIQTAYDQISLYRDVLRDDSGLWKHIVLGSWNDEAHWGTGNAWAAAGMVRVLMTMNHTSQSLHFKEHSANLTSWINEIVDTAWTYQTDNGTLLNVLDDETSFADSSATALLAAVTYRMAAFTNDSSLITFADKASELISASIDENGWLQNTVDPYTFATASRPGEISPEGQAFVILLAAAHRDWVAFNANSTFP